jgi:hypothetical protein
MTQEKLPQCPIPPIYHTITSTNAEPPAPHLLHIHNPIHLCEGLDDLTIGAPRTRMELRRHG